MTRVTRSLALVLTLAGLALSGPAMAQDDDEDAPVAVPADAPKLRTLPGALRPGTTLPMLPAPSPAGAKGVPVGGPDPGGPPKPDEVNPGARDKKVEDEDRDVIPRPRPRPGSTSPASSASAGANISGGDRNKPPCMDPAAQVTIDFVDVQIQDLVKYFAEISCKNFILGDDLKGQVTIISHHPVSVRAAYEAFLAALATADYTTVDVGSATKVVPTGEAAQNPVAVYEGGSVSSSSGYVTQIFQLENVTVSDVSSVVKDLAGSKAKIIAYAPTNTLIVTDQAINIRRMWKVVGQLDVAAPKSELAFIQLTNATAADVKQIIEEVYGSAASSSGSNSSGSASTARTTAAERRRNRRNRDKVAASQATSSSVGSESAFIQKIVADERTNSLILMANESAIEVVRELIAELDGDVDPTSRSQINVLYLEHAKAEEVASVLSNLAQASSSNNNNNNRRVTPARNRNNQAAGDNADAKKTGASAALLDDTVKITADENTNSLVIVAAPDAYKVVESVVKKLDIRRKQVFVEVVIMELASEDNMDLGLAFHMGKDTDAGGLGIGSAQLGASSIPLSLVDFQSILTGVAMGVFGPALDVSVAGETISVPAFGVVLNALQTNSSVNILSTPNILTLDNEEAKIVVGRNVPFPTSTSFSSQAGIPVTSFQREDVAITLQVTPQINESDYVTLEVFQEVTEIEESSAGADALTSGGPTTSKRSTETTVLVKDNQTVVIGGLMGQTVTDAESKVPILGDLPLIGRLFRSRTETSRKTNLLIFLTPHVINEPADLQEVYEVKMAQRQEFMRRFYGKSQADQFDELSELLSYSMNIVGEPSRYRMKAALAEPLPPDEDFQICEVYPDSCVDGVPVSGAAPAPAPAPEPAPEADPAPAADEGTD